MLLSYLLVFSLRSVVAFEQNWRHTNALRTIDLTKSYVKESLAVIIENVSNSPQSVYHVPLEAGVVYSSLEAREKSKGSGTTVKLITKKTDSSWQITLNSEIPPTEQITLSITTTKLHALRPLPAKLEQNGKQYLLHSTAKYIPSFYPCTKQKTKLKFPNEEISKYTGVADRQGTVLTYGPYESVLPGMEDSIEVRYENTVPLSTVTYLERDIEISHWGGNIAFEDRYALTNNGAKLKNPFDRIAFAQSAFYNPQSYAIKSLAIPLATGSRDAYFTDEIGNVSTSKFRSTIREANLEIKPRYPIFGGWNYTFTIGWNNDLHHFLTKDGQKHYLKVPFLEGADNIVYEDLQLRIILPEGAENIVVHCDLEDVKIRHGRHWTFMDTIGRRVVSVESGNVTEDIARQDILVEYDYTYTSLIRKPLVVVVALIVLFLASLAIGYLL